MRGTLRLPVYTFAHASVDFTCFYILYRGFGHSGPDAAALAFLVYNAAAFGLQPFIGYAGDVRRGLRPAPLGCALVIAGLAFPALPWAGLALCALGNACFHAGGGADVLRNSGGRMGPAGVFVSSGALGAALGALAGKGGLPWPLPAGLAALSAAAVLLLPCPGTGPPETAFRVLRPGAALGPALALCLLSVAIRAYGGSAIAVGWRSSPFLFVLPAAGACAGKAAGGYLADRLGARGTTAVSLLLSVPLMCFSYADPWLYTLGVALFNIPMPVTLCAVASGLPRHPGLAFGLTTLALLCGAVPAFFSAIPMAAAPYAVGALVVLSAACLAVILGNHRGGWKYDASHVDAGQAV